MREGINCGEVVKENSNNGKAQRAGAYPERHSIKIILADLVQTGCRIMRRSVAVSFVRSPEELFKEIIMQIFIVLVRMTGAEWCENLSDMRVRLTFAKFENMMEGYILKMRYNDFEERIIRDPVKYARGLQRVFSLDHFRSFGKVGNSSVIFSSHGEKGCGI